MSSQAAFLARVRRALRKEHAPAALHPPLLVADPDPHAPVASLQARLMQQRAGLVAQVQRELTAVGGVVSQVASVAAATRYIAQVAQQKQASLMVCWSSAFLHTLEVEATMQDLRLAVQVVEAASDMQHDALDSAAQAARHQELRALLARADVGLSGVDYVIAETGTLVVSARPGQMRGVSLLPPVHIAVARTEQIVATLADYLLLLRAGGEELSQHLTSCVSFITGPSRTGDIELTLTVGVHGPGELHLVLIDGTRLEV
jgi:L-lactate dehydrogenase complex protein LldG